MNYAMRIYRFIGKQPLGSVACLALPIVLLLAAAFVCWPAERLLERLLIP